MDTETVGPPAPPDSPPAVAADAEEPGAYARIPILDLTLEEAKDIVEDGSFFDNTRLAVLFHFPQIGLDDYWQLRVGDHYEIVRFLEGRGLLGGNQ